MIAPNSKHTLSLYRNLLAATFILFTAIGFTQDAQFSQFYSNPLYLNPALAGSVQCPRLTLNSRNQWPGLDAHYATYSAAYDQHVSAISGGVGVLVYNDNAGNGAVNNFRASVIYAYSKAISRKLSIRAGLNATFFQTSINWDKMKFGDMIDARYGFIHRSSEMANQTSRAGVDFSAGAMLYGENYYGGISVDHLTEPETGFSSADDQKLARKYTIHTGAVFKIKTGLDNHIKLSPNVLFQHQGEFTQFNFGLYVSKGPLVAGVWYRTGDAFIILVGVDMKKFKIGYSFDCTASNLAQTGAGGAHELSFSYKFNCSKKKKKFRTIACPKF